MRRICRGRFWLLGVVHGGGAPPIRIRPTPMATAWGGGDAAVPLCSGSRSSVRLMCAACAARKATRQPMRLMRLTTNSPSATCVVQWYTMHARGGGGCHRGASCPAPRHVRTIRRRSVHGTAAAQRNMTCQHNAPQVARASAAAAPSCTPRRPSRRRPLAPSWPLQGPARGGGSR